MPARKACLQALITACLGTVLTAGAGERAALPRLQLTPNARLEISPEFFTPDSLKAVFKLEVIPAEKYQRHLCLISTNQKKFTITLPPLQRWMLRGDSLMVLSEAELTLRAQGSAAEPFTLHFDFVNLDNPQAPSGRATVVVEKKAPALSSKTKSDSSTIAASVAPADSTPPTNVAAGDSATTATAQDSANVRPEIDARGNAMTWILIGLLLPGFAILALLNLLSRRRSRLALAKITAPSMAEKIPAQRREERAAAFESGSHRQVAFESATQTEPPKVETLSESAAPSSAIPAASVLALTKPERGHEEISALPDLHAALAQLCAVTSEVQKAVGKQFDALQKISEQVKSTHALPAQAASLQAQPRLRFAEEHADAGRETKSPISEGTLHDLGLRVAVPSATTENYEEIADAIASLAAAGKIKPPVVSLQTVAPKLEMLGRIHEGLQKLAALARASATGVSAESVETVARKVRELHLSYEAWATDQTLKMPIMLQRPANGGDNARRKIVESLLDGLYETRKIAAQGSLYFERRLSQLLEQELPKLRVQFTGEHKEEAQKIWESMV